MLYLLQRYSCAACLTEDRNATRPTRLSAFAQPEYPQPVSEYVEQTGPTTMTFLSYPKYYRNAENQLTEVDTTLRASDNPDWDYEVTTGIWTLRVRKDGTYQAEHEGDVFTYRLSDLGIGRGDEFESLKLGEPDWGRYSVLGDRIRWADVFPDVDFEVRYIHDIMKVDVIVKQKRLKEISALYANGYLTAKFEIPSVMIRSEAKQGGVARDLYAEAFELGNAPLEMVRNDRVVHKIKPTEIQLLDEQGSVLFDEKYRHIRTAQRWKLNRNASGEAELSVHLADVVDAPSDLVIDPSITFEGEGFYHGGDIYDAYLDQEYYYYSSGTDSYLYLKKQTNKEIRILIGVTHATTELAGKNILSANLYLYNDAYGGTASTAKARVYKQTRDWYMSTVRWENDGFNGQGSAWSGGEYTTDFHSNEQTLNSSPGWKTFDISQAFKSHYSTYSYDTGDKGFLVKLTSTADCYWSFPSTESTSENYRPYVVVECGPVQFGAHMGNPNDTSSYYDQRLNAIKADYIPFTRYLDETAESDGITLKVDPQWVEWFTEQLNLVGSITGFVHTPVGSNQLTNVVDTTAHFGDHVELVLEWADDNNLSVLKAFEIGGEEENKPKWYESGFSLDPSVAWYEYAGNQDMGENFSPYYVEGWKSIKMTSSKPAWAGLDVISGGAIYHHELLTNPSTSKYGSAAEFLKGFIQETQAQALADGKMKNDYLPDTISIHPYPQIGSPEYGFTGDSSRQTTEYFTRLKELFDICNTEGYIPNFATTEYGFSASSGNGQGPTNASLTSQAIYYTRFTIMNATMMPYRGIGWKQNVYWTHAQNENYDVSFLSVDGSAFGADRPIRYTARGLFNPSASPSLDLQDPNIKIWVPLRRKDGSPSQSDPSKEGYAWCGWESNGQKWGAIWRYYNDSTFGSYTNQTELFKAPISYSGLSVSAFYKLDVDESTASNTAFDLISGSSSKSTTATEVIFSVYPVTNNPLILKFN